MNMASGPARVGISGAAGRMGRSLVEAVLAAPSRLQLAAALEHGDSAELGRDIGLLLGRPALGIKMTEHWTPGTLDVLIDFTRPEATLARLERCRSEGVAMVIGTTGFDAVQQARLDAAATELALCQAGNFSLGVHLLRRLVEQASRSLGADFDIEIVETHHRHKVDAPSGTALMLGDAAARGQGRSLDDTDVFAREGHTGPRPQKAIGFSVVRGGDVVGDHEVHFLGAGERLELSHKASSRMNFAKGAVRAAAWLAGRPPGRYGLDEIFV